jgi:hypothetical protein
MSEQIPWGSILATAIGVGIGWLLSQVTDVVKGKGRKSIIRRALVNELSIVRKTFSDAPKKGENRIPDAQVPFITETYDSVRTELASFLRPDSLAVVQRTYEEIKKLNLENQRGHLVIAGSLDHIFQFSDFDKLITLIDDSVTRLK